MYSTLYGGNCEYCRIVVGKHDWKTLLDGRIIAQLETGGYLDQEGIQYLFLVNMTVHFRLHKKHGIFWLAELITGSLAYLVAEISCS
jgi:hypothetical protein